MCGSGAGTGTTAVFITIRKAHGIPKEGHLVMDVFCAAVPGSVIQEVAGPLPAITSGRTLTISLTVFASPGTCNPFFEQDLLDWKRIYRMLSPPGRLKSCKSFFILVILIQTLLAGDDALHLTSLFLGNLRFGISSFCVTNHYICSIKHT